MRLPFVLWLILWLQAFIITAWGGVYLWTWSILLLGCYAILLIVGWQKVCKEFTWRIPKSVFLVMLILGVWLAIQGLWPRTMLVDVPDSVLTALDTLQVQREFPTIFHPYRQTLALLDWLIPGIIWLVVPELLRRRHEASHFIFILVVIISTQALYGIAQFIVARDPIPFLNLPMKEHRLFWVSGSYINYNTYTCLLVMGFLLGLGIFTYWLTEYRKIKNIPRLKLVGLVIILGAFILAILLSMSRGGIVCGVFGIFCFVMMIACGHIFRHFWLRIFQIILILAIPISIYMIAIGIEPWYDKFMELPGSISGRLWIWETSLPIFTDHPWMGCGGGNYHYALCHYMSQAAYNRIGPVLYTHNDYWQFILEYGIITGIFMLALWIIWSVQVIKIFRQGISVYPKPLWFAVIAALAALMLHGIWDFSWHIPSHSLLANILMASLLARRESPSSAKQNATINPFINTTILG